MLGISPTHRPRARADETIEIWPDMVPAVTCFFSLETQWRVGPLGGRIGLDNAAIPPTAAMLGIEIKPEVYLDLRTLEDEALKTWAKQRA